MKRFGIRQILGSVHQVWSDNRLLFTGTMAQCVGFVTDNYRGYEITRL